jgi:hypothetical protein
MKALLALFICLSAHLSERALAQMPDNGFLSDPLSDEAQRMQSRFIFAHQHLSPFSNVLDSAKVSRDSLPMSLGLGFYGDIAGGAQLGSSSRGLSDGIVGLNLGLRGSSRMSLELGYSLVTQAPPSQLFEFSNAYESIWGVGDAKRKGDVLIGHMAYGMGAVRLGKYISIDAGRQKQHLGDGYRSLILGQQAAPLPFLRLNAQVHKVRFFAQWMRAVHAYPVIEEKNNRHKYLAVHGLSLNFGKRFNWSLYEMVVWQDRDTMNQRGLDLHYLNPIAFYRPLEYAQGSADNVILATSMRYKVAPKIALYMQIVLDEFNLGQLNREFKWWANKYGGQFGIKFFEVFKGFDCMFEANVVRPFTYTHGSPIQSWTHEAQPLAHPLGANFAELLWRGRYTHNRWSARLNLVYSAYGRDQDLNADGFTDNLGGDILRSYKNPYEEYGNDLLQGHKFNVLFQSSELAYAIDDRKSWEFYLSQYFRLSSNAYQRNELHGLMLGFRAVGLMSGMRDI